MRGWGLTVVALWLGGCMVPVAIPGFSTNPYKAQERAERRAAQDLSPVELAVPEGAPPPLHLFKVRAWVDGDYRKKPRWRADTEELVRRASAYTEVAFGARLEVEVKAWDRSGDASMPEMLEALAALDPGDGVDWVVGFVTAPQALTTDYHVMGLAVAVGKHFVLRDMNDADEARAVERYFADLEQSERNELYAGRKRHKSLLCFLHEWSHTLGHPHEPAANQVMSTTYSNRAASFSAPGVRLVRASLVARAGGRNAGAGLAAARQVLEDRATGWRADERSEALAMLGGEVPAALPVAAPVAAAAAVEAPTPGMRTVPAAATVAASAAARAPAAPIDPSVAVRQAYDRLQAGDRAGALGSLDGARARIVPGSDNWDTAARLYLALGALSRTDAVLATAPNDRRAAEIGKEVERIRRQAGLPADAARSAVAPDDEPEVVSAFIEGAGKLAAGDPAAARRVQGSLAKRFPRALPTVLLGCAISGAAGKVAEARKSCGAVLARWDDAIFAHFWAGQVAANPKERIAHHRRVIELDPAQEGSWQALEALYQSAHDAPALAELRRDFRVRFGRELQQP